MNKILENITPESSNIKLKFYIISKDDLLIILGNMDYRSYSYIIKSRHLYYIGERIPYTQNTHTGKVKICIDNNKIFLTTDNIILLSLHGVAIDLNNKKIYKCSVDQFKALKQHLSKRTEIFISNE